MVLAAERSGICPGAGDVTRAAERRSLMVTAGNIQPMKRGELIDAAIHRVTDPRAARPDRSIARFCATRRDAWPGAR